MTSTLRQNVHLGRRRREWQRKRSNDVGLTFEVEMKRDLFEQLHFLNIKHDFLIPTELIDEAFELAI